MSVLACLERPNLLAHYETARKKLADAVPVFEVKGILEQAEEIEALARVAKETEFECKWSIVRVRAERRLGELIQAQKEAFGLAKGTRGQLKGRDASGGFSRNPPEKTL